MWKRLIAILAASASLRCGSEMIDGCNDPLHRVNPSCLSLSCAPAVFDLECHVRRESCGFYCDPPGPLGDVTKNAKWVSSNPSVADFVAPGDLKIFAAGRVTVHAEYGFDQSIENAYDVSTTAAPEPIVRLVVTVQSAVSTGPVADARIDLVPDRGIAQTCNTDATGICKFSTWIATLQLHVSKVGFEPADVVVHQKAPPSQSLQATVWLTPQ
jgi:hypothetical protein